MEPISLHIFAKNRDATATEKGYEYQRISTLAQWLYNKVHKVSDNIYYDYGDDIFQDNEKLLSRNFKQLKLYDSKSFSFASEEIQKALSHFFMLFWQQRLKGKQTSFVFETNSGIAEKREDNGSELLKEWHQSQGAMPDDLIERCAARCKAIVDTYVNDEHKRLSGKAETKAPADDEKKKYDELGTDIWRGFILSISWTFDEIPADEALDKKIETVYTLIDELPFPISRTENDRGKAWLQNKHELDENFFEWCINNAEIFPSTQRKCSRSSELFINDKEIVDIAGSDLPVFDHPKPLSDAWIGSDRGFFGIGGFWFPTRQ